MVRLILVPLVALLACRHTETHQDSADTGDKGPGPIDIAEDRPILLFTDTSVVDANAAQLAAGFTEPQETVCAEDTSRRYLAELVTAGIGDIQVEYHWAPVVPGPDPERPTLDQPEWWFAGSFDSGGDSADDVLADHPFGLDYNFDSTADPDFSFMSFQPNEPGGLHIEFEQRILPRASFGLDPQPGGRTLLRGVWVLDCGHPPYGSEMHPPTFLSFANQQDDTTTGSFTVVLPYRSSLLFNTDLSLAQDFGNVSRLTDAASLPFPNAFVRAVVEAVNSGAPNIQSPALMVANRIEPIDQLVCAPLPRPDGASLQATWHFVARSGVSVHVTPYDEQGCVRLQASMGDDYTPMPLPYADAPWPWEEISQSAGAEYGDPVDVRQMIIDLLDSIGIDGETVPALQEDAPPLIDAYDTLDPGPGAELDTGKDVQVDDDQPYPFYGRITATWTGP